MKNLSRNPTSKLLVLLAYCATANAQTHYVVKASESYVKYFMKHPMHDWDATSQALTGSIDLSEDSLRSTASLSIPINSFDSHNGNRDSHTAECVESYIFPQVTFIGTKIVRLTTGAGKEGESTEWRIEGVLSFHGVEKNLSVPVHAILGDKRLTAEGEFELVLTDFEIELPKLMMVKVKDWLKVSFKIVAEAAG